MILKCINANYELEKKSFTFVNAVGSKDGKMIVDIHLSLTVESGHSTPFSPGKTYDIDFLEIEDKKGNESK